MANGGNAGALNTPHTAVPDSRTGRGHPFELLLAEAKIIIL